MSEELREGSFDTLQVGDKVRIVQTTEATITRFEPTTTPGLPGRIGYGIVNGGPFDGTEQWQWMPSTDDEAKVMRFKVYIRSNTPKVGSVRFRPADGSTWAATSQAGLYACIESGTTYKIGSTEFRENLGSLDKVT